MSPTQSPTRIDEIVDGIHRISTTMGSDGAPDFQFNQFLRAGLPAHRDPTVA
jgi:hypothetical protein